MLHVSLTGFLYHAVYFLMVLRVVGDEKTLQTQKHKCFLSITVASPLVPGLSGAVSMHCSTGNKQAAELGM